ncbi:ATP-binding protein [Erwinia tasmaniensis]|uniref:ATP-binding protein n=1 Tax=Erwinia tasmaniensis TaxID=338565 RepID=UPI003A4D44EF
MEKTPPGDVNLTDSTWRWLRHKRELNVAVWQPEIPPLNIFAVEGHYEGMMADYIALVSHYMGVKTHLFSFASRDQAVDALVQHQVDMVVDTGGMLTLPDSNLIKSQCFISDHPVMVFPKRAGGQQFKYQPGMRMAVSRWYADSGWIAQNFPDARITRFDTDEQGMASVAFGENEIYVGNLITTSYLLNRNFTNLLDTQLIYPLIDTGSRFVMRISDKSLFEAVTQSLEAIPTAQAQVISHRWSEGAELWRFRKPVEFSAREKKWLINHPNVGVSVNPLSGPLTMIDVEGNFHGVTADVLRLIGLRTGIHFEPVPAASFDQIRQQISSGQTAFIGAVSQSEARGDIMSFSRPWFKSPFVTVVKKDALSGEITPRTRVAMVRGNALENDLQKSYPGIRIIETENASEALEKVDDGEVDMAVHTYIGANYMIERHFKNQLRIAGRAGNHSAEISFGVSRNQPELLSILNKSLENISSAEIGGIITRWQTKPDVHLDSWVRYKRQFWLVLGITSIIILTSLVWIFYLRRENRARRRAEQKLNSQLVFSKTLINTLPVPVYVLNVQGNIVLFNQALSQFFKGEQRQRFGLPLSDISSPLHHLWQEINSKINPDSCSGAAEMYFSHLSDGESPRSIIHYAVPFTDSRQHKAGFICTWMDITEHEELTAALYEARERAEQANRAKSTFLATMSHEIRTPVSAIIGLLELAVKTTSQEDERDESIRVAWESARALMSLLGDILDIARIESGRLELVSEWVKTHDLLPPVVRVFEGLARQKSLFIRSTVPRVLPDEVFIDPQRFRQVLSNLVSNAIKFTDKGGVDVELEWVNAKQPDETELIISVRDSGMGVAEEEQKTLFTPWVQASAGRSQKGSGLGLAICSQLVNMMGGEIILKSRQGQGTTVTLRIPVAKRNTQSVMLSKTISPGRLQTAPLRILAVDDHPANRMLLRRQLMHLGHAVTEASDGEQAWALWQQGQFDLVITDCNMPGMDGLTLTRLIREHQRRPAIVLGLTANAWAGELSRCQAAGMDDCLFKPLQLPHLEEILSQASARLSLQPLERGALDAFLDMGKLRILTNHDNNMLLELLTLTLRSNRDDLLMATDLYELEDWPELASCIHRLSGAAQIIGAVHAEGCCRQLEEACLAREADISAIDRRWQQVREAVDALNAGLEKGCREVADQNSAL